MTGKPRGRSADRPPDSSERTTPPNRRSSVSTRLIPTWWNHRNAGRSGQLLWGLLRPTYFVARRANRIVKRGSTEASDTTEAWRENLGNVTKEQRPLAINVLLSIYESDQNRIRGLESKALGVLTIVGLTAAVDLAGVALVLTEGDAVSGRLQLIFWLLLGSSVSYLLFSLLSIYETIIPGERHVVGVESALPPENAGVAAAVATRLNRSAGIVRSNLVDAALRDTARGLLVALGALVIAVAAN